MKEKKPKVLMIGPYPPPYGGVAICIKNILESGLNKRYNIILLNTLRNKKEKGKFLQINKINRVILDVIKLIRILIKESPKLVHIHTSYDLGWPKHSLYLLISRLFRKKVVLHFHAIKQPKKRYFPMKWDIEYIFPPKLIFKMCDAIIVLSKNFREKISLVTHEKRIIIIPNGLHLSRFGNERPCQENLNEERIRVLYLGNLERRKGIYELIKAIPKVHTLNKNVEFLIVGGGPEANSVKGILDKKRNKYCKYLGRVDEEYKLSLLKKGDIFVLQSFSEGLPISILEAMASGLAIISTPVDAIPDVVKDGKNGLLIEPGNVDQLVSAILKLSKDKSLREKISEANIEKIQNYDMKVIARKIEDVYSKVLV